jgi:hypothetical protein
MSDIIAALPDIGRKISQPPDRSWFQRARFNIAEYSIIHFMVTCRSDVFLK